MGHNLGSRHTHWCGWKSDTGTDIGRLDSCYRGESSSGPNNCLPNTYSVTSANTKGSIMSYCHLNGAISFTTGFGKYPRYAIRSNLANASEIPLDGGSLPTIVNADSVSNKKVFSAVFGGNVTSDGGYPIQQRGVIWSLVSSNVLPTFNLSTKTSDGTGTGTFTSTMTPLIANNTYWVRSYAKNAVGISYGDTVRFKTLFITAPEVSTSTISNITSTSAVATQTITNSGNLSVIEKGVVVSTSPNPDITTGTKFTQGLVLTTFSATMTGLIPNTLYYVRSFVRNSQGTAYGTETSFTTLQSSQVSITTIPPPTGYVGSNFIYIFGSIIFDGGSTVTEKGVCLTAGPGLGCPTPIKITGGTNSNFSGLFTNLLPNTTYYGKTYCINALGTFYGPEIAVTTLPNIITIDQVSDIEATKATIKYTIAPNNFSLVNSGILLSVAPNTLPTQVNKVLYFTTPYIQTGQNTLFATGLTPNTTYYARAVTYSSTNVEYAGITQNVFQFTTTTVAGTPIVTTSVPIKTGTSVSIGGNVSSTGTSRVYSRGIVYSTAPNPTIQNSNVQVGQGIGQYNTTVTNLTPGVLYYFRAYATNNSGTTYGEERNLTISGNPPTVTTNEINSISLTTANCGGNVTNTGGGIVSSRGIVWSTSTNPSINLTTKTADGTGFGEYVSALTGLTQNTKYYIRAYAVNENGTGYGQETSFTTLPAPSVANVVTTKPTNILATSAETGGVVTYDGGSSVTSKGVCWSTNRNPTITDQFTFNGTGVGSFTSFISGLNLGVTYYVRAYATNSTGTSYGSEYTITTSEGTPSLTTTIPSNIRINSATSGGIITSTGNTNVLSRGVCWSTSPNPSAELPTKTVDGIGSGSFTSNILGLNSSTTYYVRAYATNTVGTSYGQQFQFTTSPETGGECVLSGLKVYKNENNAWTFTFNLNQKCGNYSVNVCRYNSSNPNIQPNLTEKPISCGIRNGMKNYSAIDSEILSNSILREMLPQPTAATKSGFGGWWYSIDVRCNASNCFGSDLTKYYFYVP
jgi:hypothetical protein